jgi:V8-like Glu-specific endopeptidase
MGVKRESDYALAYLADQNVGKAVSWFGLAAVPDSGLDDLLLNIAGYSNHTSLVAQYYDGGRLMSFDSDYLYHRFDTEKGMSGAPIIVRRNERRYVIGIHTWGGTNSNRARRLDNKLFDEISRRLA